MIRRRQKAARFQLIKSETALINKLAKGLSAVVVVRKGKGEGEGEIRATPNGVQQERNEREKHSIPATITLWHPPLAPRTFFGALQRDGGPNKWQRSFYPPPL